MAPEIFVYLVRLVDGGHLLPRARVKLQLGGVVPDVQHVPELAGLLTRDLTLDLFEKPPHRERIREEAVRLASQNPHWTQRQIASALAEKPTTTVVQQALAMDRRMRELGLESPRATALFPRRSQRLR